MTHLMSNYGRFPVAMVKGDGITLWDANGREYLDFVCGIAVTSLGHNHPKVTQAIQEQAGQLLHVSNLYQIPGQERAADKLCALTGLDRAFFCNSGAEANEAAIKLARKYSKQAHGEHKYEVLTLTDCFHGRTLATVTATNKPKYLEGFTPAVPGFRQLEKDLAQIEASLSDVTCAILVEPVQGEGGVVPLPKEFLQGLRALCDEKGLLLIFDEAQTGIGRTGTMFAFEQAGVLPDIVTLAKALANGVPVGAIVAKEAVAAAFTPGTHGSTFGGNPLAMAALNATLTAIEEEGLLANAQAMGTELAAQLEKLVGKFDCVLSQRGLGLLRGLVFDRPVGPIINKCLEKGLLVLNAGDNVLRLLPPLIVSAENIHVAVQVLEEALQDVLAEAAVQA
ncbi:MAG: acetylornithine transaminase [Tumebacillaceae bacterium]